MTPLPLPAQNPPGITAPDVALARKSIFSPESGAVIPNQMIPLLDTNHDGVISLEDLNGLASSHSKWKTLFVAPAPPSDVRAGQPVGTYRNPFVLTETTVTSNGGFYDQIRKITFGSPPLNAEVIFLPGTYSRIQLLLRNADLQPPAGKPLIKAVIDPAHPARLLLRSLYGLSADPAKAAHFFGGSQGTGSAGILKYGPALRLVTDGPNGSLPYSSNSSAITRSFQGARFPALPSAASKSAVTGAGSICSLRLT